MKTVWYGVLLILFTLIACKDRQRLAEIKLGDYQFSFGTACGQCSKDTLYVVDSKVHYVSFRNCVDSRQVLDTILDTEEWNKLLYSVDFDKLQTINIKTCNRCTDGCDFFLRLDNGMLTHTVSFGLEDSTSMEGIKPLIDQLEELRNRFSTVSGH
jgi:hypothetical protein